MFTARKNGLNPIGIQAADEHLDDTLSGIMSMAYFLFFVKMLSDLLVTKKGEKNGIY